MTGADASAAPVGLCRRCPPTIAAAAFLSCYLTWRPSQDIMFTLSDVFFLAGLAGLVLHHRIPIEPFRFLTPAWIGGFALLVTGLLIGSLTCPTPGRWPIVAGQYLFAWVVLPMALLGHGANHTRGAMKAFVWGVFAMNLFGAVVYFTYSGTFEQANALFGLDFLSGGRRLGAFASDANWNGAVLAMAVPTVLFLRARQEIGKLLAVVWLTVLLLGVMLSASFTAFASCVAAVTLLAIVGGVRPTGRKLAALLAAVGALAGALATGQAFLPSTFVQRVGNAVSSGDISEAGTFEGRMTLIREAWTIVEHHMIVGVGADQYRVVSQYKAPVHNMYLLLWAEGGLLSLVGWLAMMVVPIVAAVLCFRRDRIAAALTLSVTTNFLIASTASPHMYARLWAVPMLLALGASLDRATAPQFRWRPGARARRVLRTAV